MTLKHQITTLIPLAIIVAGLLGYNLMSAQWSGPTALAPNNNTEAPINVGPNYQPKIGDLGAVRMRAGAYCDETGNNCFQPGVMNGAGWIASNQVVFNGSITGSGTGDTGGVDLNLASIVGTRETLVQLMVTTSDNTTNSFAFKPKGVAGVQGTTVGSGAGAGASALQIYGTANRIGYVTVTTNASGIVLMQSYATQNVQVRLVGYIRSGGTATSSPDQLKPGWPDIIMCQSGTNTFYAYLDYGRLKEYGDDVVTYSTPASGGVYIGVYFDLLGRPHPSYPSMWDCNGKTLTEIIQMGRAWQFNVRKL